MRVLQATGKWAVLILASVVVLLAAIVALLLGVMAELDFWLAAKRRARPTT